MKARIKFRKYGVMKFIGHLDVMRFFQKAMRRADIPIAFTSGYSPHMIMSFAQPLGIGLTSEAEYMDVELARPISSAKAVEQLNQVMVEGIDIVSFLEIPEDKKSSGMTIVAAADYLVLPGEGELSEELARACTAFMDMEEIVVWKKTKRSEKETDIKPMIYDFHLQDGGIYLKLAAGSSQNLKPDLVMQALFDMAGIPVEEFPLCYHRLEVYAADEHVPGHFVSLESLGWEITGETYAG